MMVPPQVARLKPRMRPKLAPVLAVRKVPSPTRDSTKPTASSTLSASRTLYLPTPRASLSARSEGRRSPGRRPPDKIYCFNCSRVWSLTLALTMVVKPVRLGAETFTTCLASSP